VSLSRGHIRTGGFKINQDATYFVEIELGAKGTANCGGAYGHDAVQTMWTATIDGKAIPQDGKLPRAGCDLGTLWSGPGQYALDIEVVSDTAALNTLHPRLHIEALWWVYDAYNDTAGDFFTLGLFLATIGASLLVLSSFGPNPRWPEEQSLNISPPRGNRVRIKRRDSPLLDSRSTVPLVGYLYAVSCMIVFLVNAPFYLATWEHSAGLPARLVRPGAALARTDGETGLLVYVDQSGKLYFHAKPITAQELPRVLETELARRADHSVFVEGDSMTDYGSVAQAMNLVRAAGGEVIMMTPKFRAETSGSVH
jgi:biopolymer transport protein ExbD